MAARALAANGATGYITGRRRGVLENVAKTHSPDLQRKYINLLICNAGVAGRKAEPSEEDADDLKKKLWDNESVEEWQETLHTDATFVYFTTVAFLPLLQRAISAEGGPFEDFSASVITTSSISGLMRHAQGHFTYNAANAGAVHLTKLMSAKCQDARIRVNSIAPGYFPSEMKAKQSDENIKSEFPQEKIEKAGYVPLMRAGRDEEIGMTVLYLAKNHYIN